MPGPEIFTPIINNYFPEPQASLLNGILFGVDLKGLPVFYRQLKEVGLMHMVVLSGMNITLLAGIIAILTRQLPKKLSAIFTIVSIVVFILFVGAEPPIIRAGFMGVLSLVAIVYGRKAAALYLLILSALFIGVFWSEWLNTISFQLSYGATLGMILFGSVGEQKDIRQERKIVRSILTELRTSLSAQIFTVPIILYYFKQVSLIAPIANILVAFIVPVLMIFGFLTAILGKIHFILGLAPALICYGLLTYIVGVVDVLSRLPFVFFQL